MDSTSIKCLNHPCAQIKIKDGFFVIPKKYHELFIEDLDVDFIPATSKNWKRIHAIYVSAFWLDTWYQDHLPTPKTKFIDFDEEMKWSTIYFIRLTSLSSKTKQPYSSFKAALEDIKCSERCQKSHQIAKLQIAVREWVDLSKGKEYRCVIFECKLKKIVPNDMRIGIHSSLILKERCQKLVDKMKNNFPCVDNIMDVWIADEIGDLVLEFNSFGIIGNSYSDDIDFCDIELYLDGECTVII